jgi:hypothetical protein
MGLSGSFLVRVNVDYQLLAASYSLLLASEDLRRHSTLADS